MGGTILKGKRILAVDDEPDVLTVLEEEVKDVYPDCQFDKATSYDEAVAKMASSTYDAVILDIMGVRGFDLLDLAVKKKFPVAMLTAHALNPEALKRSFEMGARAYLPKEKLGEIVPFLEDMLRYDFLYGWKRLLEKLEAFFTERWGKYWKKTEEKFWKEIDETTTQDKK